MSERRRTMMCSASREIDDAICFCLLPEGHEGPHEFNDGLENEWAF